MVVRNEVAWDGVPAHNAGDHRALPIGAVAVVVAYVAVQVESG